MHYQHDGDEEQKNEGIGLFWGLMMFVYVAGIGFFLMIAITVVSIWELMKLGYDALRARFR